MGTPVPIPHSGKTKNKHMAKKDTEEEKAGAVDPDRQARWDAHLARAKAQNPRQFAIDEENGEFKEIPATFV